MQQQLGKLALVLAFIGDKTRTAATAAWRALIGDQADNYRPEMHYMRGPGPKCRAKKAQASNPR